MDGGYSLLHRCKFICKLAKLASFFIEMIKSPTLAAVRRKKGWRDLCNYVDTSAINVRAAEAVLHLEERISGTGYSFIIMI